jgi:hypothetical protein
MFPRTVKLFGSDGKFVKELDLPEGFRNLPESVGLDPNEMPLGHFPPTNQPPEGRSHLQTGIDVMKSRWGIVAVGFAIGLIGYLLYIRYFLR